jgi:hypothetical protein
MQRVARRGLWTASELSTPLKMPSRGRTSSRVWNFSDELTKDHWYLLDKSRISFFSFVSQGISR